jgi:hypothetical protein
MFPGQILTKPQVKSGTYGHSRWIRKIRLLGITQEYSAHWVRFIQMMDILGVYTIPLRQLLYCTLGMKRISSHIRHDLQRKSSYQGSNRKTEDGRRETGRPLQTRSGYQN